VIGGRVLDTSALEDFATGKSVYSQTLVWVALEHGIVLAVPATALMAAWASVPTTDPHPLSVLLDLPVTVVDHLDETAAREAGLLVGAAMRGANALAPGHVAWTAHRRGWPVITAQPERLRAIDPDVQIEPLP
jgi:hypothetical protein